MTPFLKPKPQEKKKKGDTFNSEIYASQNDVPLLLKTDRWCASWWRTQKWEQGTLQWIIIIHQQKWVFKHFTKCIPSKAQHTVEE